MNNNMYGFEFTNTKQRYLFTLRITLLVRSIQTRVRPINNNQYTGYTDSSIACLSNNSR